MATALETGSEPRTPTPPASLPVASLFGALYVVAALAVVFYAVPAFWSQTVSPALARLGFFDDLAKIAAQVAALVALIWFGRKLLGDNPPKGIHGGIFLMISAAITIFFFWRAVALNFEGPAGLVISCIVAGFFLFLAFKFFTGSRGQQKMIGLEEQGWFSTAGYKKSLGQKARRLTILGILLLAGSGIYTLWTNGTLPEDWSLSLPFESLNSFTVIPNAKLAVPLLLLLATLWFAWRAVNVPTFAEFLIATEAEMNKVSWTPKRRLAQDTVVVLTTTLILTLFLLVVDIFWSWLLSTKTVGVLPPRSTETKGSQAQQAKW